MERWEAEPVIDWRTTAKGWQNWRQTFSFAYLWPRPRSLSKKKQAQLICMLHFTDLSGWGLPLSSIKQSIHFLLPSFTQLCKDANSIVLLSKSSIGSEMMYRNWLVYWIFMGFSWREDSCRFPVHWLSHFALKVFICIPGNASWH